MLFAPNTPAPPGLWVRPNTPAPPAPPPVGASVDSLLPNTPTLALDFVLAKAPLSLSDVPNCPGMSFPLFKWSYPRPAGGSVACALKPITFYLGSRSFIPRFQLPCGYRSRLQGHQLAPAERTGEAEREDGAVADADHAVRADVQHRPDAFQGPHYRLDRRRRPRSPRQDCRDIEG